jgi:hypothetical protein
MQILPHLETEIVKRSDQAKVFKVLPRRWVVERTIAWASIVAAGWPRIGSASTSKASPSSASHPFA